MSDRKTKLQTIINLINECGTNLDKIRGIMTTYIEDHDNVPLVGELMATKMDENDDEVPIDAMQSLLASWIACAKLELKMADIIGDKELTKYINDRMNGDSN